MFRPAREGSDSRFFEIRAILLVVGASVGLAGMVTERLWLTWIGIGILLLAIATRLLRKRSE